MATAPVQPAVPSSPEAGPVRLPWLPPAAAVLGAAAYWAPFLRVLGRCSVGQWAALAELATLFVLGFAAGLLRDKAVGRAALLGFGLGWVADVSLSLQLPRTFHCSHQLLPFEAVLVVGGAALAVALGRGLGLGLTRWRFASRPVPAAADVAALLLGVAIVLVMVSTVLLPLQLRWQEARAATRITQMARAQFAYAASHPQAGFSCALQDLDASIGHTDPYQVGGVRSQNIWSGGFRYRLSCVQPQPPRSDFLLEATPFCVPDCGDTAYCVDGSGAIRAIGADAAARCIEAGREIGRVR